MTRKKNGSALNIPHLKCRKNGVNCGKNQSPCQNCSCRSQIVLYRMIFVCTGKKTENQSCRAPLRRYFRRIYVNCGLDKMISFCFLRHTCTFILYRHYCARIPKSKHHTFFSIVTKATKTLYIILMFTAMLCVLFMRDWLNSDLVKNCIQPLLRAFRINSTLSKRALY